MIGTFLPPPLTSIQLKLSNGYQSPALYRYPIGTSFSFNVPTGQLITFIYICINMFQTIYSIQFITNQGVQSPTYGAVPYIQYDFVDFNCFNVSLPGGLLGIRGHAQESVQLVDRLDFASNKPVHSAVISTLAYSVYSFGLCFIYIVYLIIIYYF